MQLELFVLSMNYWLLVISHEYRSNWKSFVSSRGKCGDHLFRRPNLPLVGGELDVPLESVRSDSMLVYSDSLMRRKRRWLFQIHSRTPQHCDDDGD